MCPLQVLVRCDGHHDDGHRAAAAAQRRAQVGPVRARRGARTLALPRRLLCAPRPAPPPLHHWALTCRIVRPA